MQLQSIDWWIIGLFFLISIAIGVVTSKKAQRSFSDYFLAGGSMPWWLLGVSMVATTFSADTPNFVTELVRTDGVSGNWIWWAFLVTGMLTVFIYAKLWKRSGVLTDLEFYEIRYSGKPASFLRGFRAVFLGVIFNCLIMATVNLAGIKISSILLGITPLQTVMIAGTVTVIYTMLGGLRGVIFTDFFQFIISMVGVIGAAIILVRLPEVDGIASLLQHPEVSSKINIFPDFNNKEVIIPLLILPLAVQWWANWYPGAEPGGGGYIAQRMLSAKSESDATGATLFFNIAHYALRPWPWIIIGLASIIVFPELSDIQAAFPNIDQSIIKDDIAFPAMLSLLPKGFLGLVIAGLIAAFMSTISTHLNWGSSYLTNDLYKRFFNPEATDQKLVSMGRIFTLVLMIISSWLALQLESARDSFDIILQIGAGTGLIYIMRWFWWRINAFSEIAGMVSSLFIVIYFHFIVPAFNLPEISDEWKLLLGVGITTIFWVLVTLLTRPTDEKVLESFYQKIKPDGSGWKPVEKRLQNQGIVIKKDNTLTVGIAAMFVATCLVYALLFSFGWLIFGNKIMSLTGLVIAGFCSLFLWRIWPRLKMR